LISPTIPVGKGGSLDDKVENQDSSSAAPDLHVAWTVLSPSTITPRHACCPVAAKVIPDDLFTWDGTIESDDREESQAKDHD